MRYKAILTHDHDQKVKLEQEEILCYSKKQLDKIHPDGAYSIVGETKKGNKKEEIGRFIANDKEFIVSELGKNNSILHRRAGYVRVGSNEYVALLKSRLGFLLILLGLLAILFFLLRALIIGPDIPVVDPVNPLPDPDQNAVQVQPEGPNKDDADSQGDQHGNTDVEEGGGSVSMIYTLEADVTLGNGNIAMYFKNPTDSTHDVVVELYVVSEGKEFLVAQSGRIPAGYELSTMSLVTENAILSEGVYSGLYKVQCYDPITGELALVAPEITDLEISVKP